MRNTGWRETKVATGDGSKVAVLSRGAGPGIVVVPGENRRAHHYEALARGLSGAHAVHVVERRGRGASAPRGTSYSVETEVDDVLAVMDHLDARMVFGHSYGGLIGLHVALRRSIDDLVVYEPGVSIDGSFDASWLDGFVRQLDAGRRTTAMATFLRGTALLPVRSRLLLWTTSMMLVRDRETRELMPTTPAEIGEIVRLDSDGSRYGEITTRTLLLGGEKSPACLTGVLPQLAAIMPNAEYAVLPGLDHNAPDQNAPDTVAQQIRLHLVRAERQAAGSVLAKGSARRLVPRQA